MLFASGLGKSYGDAEVVRGVDVNLEPGRIVGLVGANGAGKTTTLKMLAGLVEPTEGTVTLDGTSTLDARARQRIGFLPEQSPLYDEQTARGYLAFFGSLYGMEKPAVRERGDALLDELGLDASAREQPIGTLSKGMRRKVAIARTLLHEPDVILLDEPTSGLDPVTARDVETFVETWREQGKAILLSAHDLPQVEQLCDEVIVMHEGEVALSGTVPELREKAGTRSYTVQATEPFEDSHERGSLHEAKFESWERVEAATRQVRDHGGEIVEVDASLPGLETLMHRLAGA